MSINHFFGRASLIAILVVALSTGLSFARGGGGGGGGHGGGGFGGGGGGFHGGGGWGGGGYHGGWGGSYGSGWSGGTRAGSFGSIAPSHAFSGGEFAHSVPSTGYSAGRYANAFGNRGYGDYFGHGWGHGHGHGYGGYGGWGWGWGGFWPLYGGWGLGSDWGEPYGYSYDYPDAGDYYYSYAPTSLADNGAIVDSGAAAPEQFAGTSEIVPTISSEDQQGAAEGVQFYSEARTAFLSGDYKNALRLGGHAAVDAPQNAKVHELISLALFAQGNYRPAASEAHAAMALGAIAEWKDLYGYYENVDKYTTQLRALEKAAAANPNDAADHFLLGYQYLMTGARDNAKTEFAEAVKLTPKDKLADYYLQKLESNSPLTPPLMASKPQGKSL